MAPTKTLQRHIVMKIKPVLQRVRPMDQIRWDTGMGVRIMSTHPKCHHTTFKSEPS